MASRSTAFCPGHITAFFEIFENSDILRKGSRGAGLCLSKGVVTSVEVSNSANQEISVYVDGRFGKGSVTELAVRKWLGNRRLEVNVDSVSQLPISQGFGMSGAGALSTAVALADAVQSNETMEELVRIAHIAEVESLTGLGDVYPQAIGGLVIRELPGAPPYGRLRKIDVDQELVLCILGGELKTKKVLQDKSAVARINSSGGIRVDTFMSNPSLDSLFVLSREFAEEAELASDKVREVIESCEEFGRAGMSMLGNSIFAFGETDVLVKILERQGKAVRCNIESRGVRII